MSRFWKLFMHAFQPIMPKIIQIVKSVREVEANSRTIEYPFVIKNMVELERGRVLDVGSAGTNLPTELASLGFQVYCLDPRKYYVKYDQTHPIQGDILKSPFRNISFDMVVAVSTIEHIGINEYVKLTDTEGDWRAVKEISRILKTNGILLLTLPFGKSARNRKTIFRIYNSSSIRKLTQEFQTEAVEFYANTGKYWFPVSKEKAEATVTTHWSKAVILLKLAKRKEL